MNLLPKVAGTLREPGSQIGRGVSRVDGPLKVTGRAKYAAEFNEPGLTHGYIVSSAITKGRITKIDTSAALTLPGVLHVFTHENRPSLAWFDRKWKDDDAPPGSPFRPLYDEKIVHAMQPVALVVAETFELARYGARLVKVDYASEPHETNLRAAEGAAYEPPKGKGGYEPPPKPRGDAEAAFEQSAVKVSAEYFHPAEHHNPMEPHASTVIYDDDGTFRVYDKTQGAQNSHRYLCNVFGLSTAQVRVQSPFVGGAFGSGLRPQHQLFMATMAAIELKRSVRVELSRPQMFTFGHRPETIQRVKIGASPDGKLQAILQEAVSETSRFEDYTEIVVNWSGQSYQCDNVKLGYKVSPLDVYTPLDMRAPGAATGVYALECAMDELAHAAKIDPLELRLINYAERDQNHDKPFSSKELRACYSQGAERFGWSKRNPIPRSMRDGRYLIGWGMAGGVWDAMQGQASAKATLSIDGRLVVASATADIGTGTYTVMTQIAADTLGLPMQAVTFKLGDSSLPMSPIQGGSWTVSSVGSAVKVVCDGLREKLFKLARKVPHSPLADASLDDVVFLNGGIQLRSDPGRHVSLQEAMRHGEVLSLEETTRSLPNYIKQMPYTRATHSAVFVEVRIDPEIRSIGVSRVVSAVAAGRIMNPKTARSQVLGAAVWGIGMAMHEETFTDHKLGRYVNHDLAEYHIPVNADIHDIEVIFVEEHDDIVNPLGAKGVGEIGIVGVSAAVANAVFHATGKRVRDLPITIDKLL